MHPSMMNKFPPPYPGAYNPGTIEMQSVPNGTSEQAPAKFYDAYGNPVTVVYTNPPGPTHIHYTPNPSTVVAGVPTTQSMKASNSRAEGCLAGYQNKETTATASKPARQPVDATSGEDSSLSEKPRKSKRKKDKKGSRRGSLLSIGPEESKDLFPMEEFFKQMEEINEGLAKIEQNCAAMDMAYQMILGLVSDEDIREQEQVISGLTTSTNRTSVVIREKLRTMEAETGMFAPTAPTGSGDLRMRRVNHAALLQKFANLMNQFQRIQQEAQAKSQAQVQRQYNIVNPEANQEEVDNVAKAVGAMNLTSQQIFSLGQTRNPSETLDMMKRRRKDVMDIEKDIYALHQMSADLENIVQEQSGLIDNLQDHWEQAVTYTEEAEKHMKEAAETQRNIRRLHCNII